MAFRALDTVMQPRRLGLTLTHHVLIFNYYSSLFDGTLDGFWPGTLIPAASEILLQTTKCLLWMNAVRMVT